MVLIDSDGEPLVRPRPSPFAAASAAISGATQAASQAWQPSEPVYQGPVDYGNPNPEPWQAPAIDESAFRAWDQQPSAQPAWEPSESEFRRWDQQGQFPEADITNFYPWQEGYDPNRETAEGGQWGRFGGALADIASAGQRYVGQPIFGPMVGSLVDEEGNFDWTDPGRWGQAALRSPFNPVSPFINEAEALLGGKDPYTAGREEYRRFEESNAPVGLKVGANVLTDPTTWLGVGALGGLAKPGRIGKIAAGLIENPYGASIGSAVGAGVGAQIGEDVENPWLRTGLMLGGGVLGGVAPGVAPRVAGGLGRAAMNIPEMTPNFGEARFIGAVDPDTGLPFSHQPILGGAEIPKAVTPGMKASEFRSGDRIIDPQGVERVVISVSDSGRVRVGKFDPARPDVIPTHQVESYRPDQVANLKRVGVPITEMTPKQLANELGLPPAARRRVEVLTENFRDNTAPVHEMEELRDFMAAGREQVMARRGLVQDVTATPTPEIVRTSQLPPETAGPARILDNKVKAGTATPREVEALQSFRDEFAPEVPTSRGAAQEPLMTPHEALIGAGTPEGKFPVKTWAQQAAEKRAARLASVEQGIAAKGPPAWQRIGASEPSSGGVPAPAEGVALPSGRVPGTGPRVGPAENIPFTEPGSLSL